METKTIPTGTMTQPQEGGRFKKVASQQPTLALTPRVRTIETVEVVPNENMVRLPREMGDRRVRTFTATEITFITEMYKAGKSRRAISKLMDCSHAPIIRCLYENGVLKKNHYPRNKPWVYREVKDQNNTQL